MTSRMTPLLEHNEQFARTFTPVPLGLPAAPSGSGPGQGAGAREPRGEDLG